MGGARTGLALSCWDDIRDRGPSSWWLQGSPVHALLGQGAPEGTSSKLGFAAQLFLDSFLFFSFLFFSFLFFSFLFFSFFLFVCFETGFICVALTVVQLTL